MAPINSASVSSPRTTPSLNPGHGVPDLSELPPHCDAPYAGAERTGRSLLVLGAGVASGVAAVSCTLLCPASSKMSSAVSTLAGSGSSSHAGMLHAGAVSAG